MAEDVDIKIDRKSITSIDPFNKNQSKLISFMCKISKLVYNSSLFTNTVLRLFSEFIYSDFVATVLDKPDKFQSKFSDLPKPKTNNNKKIQKKKINSRKNKSHISDQPEDESINPDKLVFNPDHLNNFLLDTINVYYKFYSDNYFLYKPLINSIWSFLKDKNKSQPIINSTYDAFILDTIKHVNIVKADLEKTYNKKINNEDIFTKIIIGEIKYAVNWFYIRNFHNTREEILSKKPITINNKKFIEHVKSNVNNAINVEHINYKENAEKKLNVSLNSNKYLVKLITKMNFKDDVLCIPMDVIDNILDKTYEGYESHIKKIQKGLHSKLQKYKQKDEQFLLSYTKSSRKTVKIGNKYYIRFNIGEYISQKYIEITGNNKLGKIISNNKCARYVDIKYLELIDTQKKSTHLDVEYAGQTYKLSKKLLNKVIDGNYLYVQLPKKLIKEEIGTINICPMYENGYKYKLCYPYKSEKQEMKKNDVKDLNNYIFIDLGMVNLMTILDPMGTEQLMISGSEIINMNYYYNDIIDNKKSENLKEKRHTSNKIRDILIRRENKINDYFEKVCKWINEKYKEKKFIVIGYNVNWKNKVNMGRKMNQKFYNIPYAKLIDKLRNKSKKCKKEVILINEAYTSKCDGLAKEEIKKHEKYIGRRISRGIFKSSIGKRINADINGALNIGRKYMLTKKVEIEGKEIKNIYNPKKVRDIKKELWNVDKKTTEVKGNSNTKKNNIKGKKKGSEKELQKNPLSLQNNIVYS